MCRIRGLRVRTDRCESCVDEEPVLDADPTGFTRVREIGAGEMVIITTEGKLLSQQVTQGGRECQAV